MDTLEMKERLLQREFLLMIAELLEKEKFLSVDEKIRFQTLVMEEG